MRRIQGGKQREMAARWQYYHDTLYGKTLHIKQDKISHRENTVHLMCKH